MENMFQIRAYGTSELASLYNPHVHPNSAVRTLRQWIDHYPNLRSNLTAIGLQRKAHSFTPAQVAMIVDALGEP